MILPNGFRVILVQPRKVYRTRIRQGKSKVGKRNVRVRKLVGLVELIENDKFLINENKQTIMCGPEVYERLKNEIKLENKVARS